MGSEMCIRDSFSGIAGDGFRTLAEGAKVEYELGESAKGPQATNVRII